MTADTVRGLMLALAAIAGLTACAEPDTQTAPIETVAITLGECVAQSPVVAAGPAFRDCPECPAMMPLATGSFCMGSPEGEGDADEHPLRAVTVPAFAMARTEVTFAQWDACVADGFCRPVTDDAGWGRQNRPVMNVSWADITGEEQPEPGFLAWLNEQVEGMPYRLPSEAEWEYAARAGTTTLFSWGDDSPDCDETAPNGAAFNVCTDGRTWPVASFPANAFGLHDMHGNVWEWMADCWHFTYEKAPTDGSAWLEADRGDCAASPVRGGAWSEPAKFLRAANRSRHFRGHRYTLHGFRVAKTQPQD